MNYQTSSQPSRQHSERAAGDLFSILNGLVEAPFVWLERLQDRRRLAELDDHMLRDIGISRSEAEQVASTPFWRR
jgi:uncharacterized protein YjiS (DUF1127 family)